MPAFGHLRTFLTEPEPSAGTLGGVLRGAFAAAFAAQGLVAWLVASLLALLGGTRADPTPWLGSVAIAGSALLLSFGLASIAIGTGSAASSTRRLADERRSPPPGASAHAAATPAAADVEAGHAAAEQAAFLARLRAIRTGALSVTLMGATLASGPLWFAAIAWLGGNRGAAFAGALGLAALGCLAGPLQAGRLARAMRLPSRAVAPAGSEPAR